MKYLVMECHPAYAVVLDEKGSFHKVANQNFQVGQLLDHVVLYQPPRPFLVSFIRPFTIAACVLLVLGLFAQYLLTPAGSVRLSVNPDLVLTVNRLDMVIDASGLNTDGVRLLDNCHYRFRNIHKVLVHLTQQAEAMDLLSQGDTILLLPGADAIKLSDTELLNWAAELDVDTNSRFCILTQPQSVPSADQTDPADTSAPHPTESDDDEDDDDEEDDEDDDDEDEDNDEKKGVK